MDVLRKDLGPQPLGIRSPQKQKQNEIKIKRKNKNKNQKWKQKRKQKQTREKSHCILRSVKISLEFTYRELLN